MGNLLILLACIFGGVALMVFITGKFAAPADEEKALRLRRWIYPLVGVLLVLQALQYFLGGD